MRSFSPMEYSVCVGESYCAVDSARWAPASSPDSVAWSNRPLSELQFHALSPIVKFERVSPGKGIVYAVCGTSRKPRPFQKLRFRTMYIDATHASLRLVLECGTVAALLVEAASRFPVRGRACASVSDIDPTPDVLASRQIFVEIIRVVLVSDCLVAMELFRGRDAHVSLRRDWTEQAKSSGTKLLAWFSKKCFAIRQLLVRAIRTLGVWDGKTTVLSFILQVSSPPPVRIARRHCGVLPYTTALASAWAETVSETICFGRLALRGTPVFRI
jgi:hypothetical protein